MEEIISLRDLQIMENEILIKFDKFCKEHDLRYTLIGGTLLGAVRHNGFIPWDDDIDVGMPRPDYDKFLQLTQKIKVADGLSVISGDYDSDFYLPFAKVCDDSTQILEDSQTHMNTANSVWIDIMPFDGVGSNYEKAVDIMKKADTLQKALGRATSVPWKRRFGEKGIKGFLRCAFRQLYHIKGFKLYKEKLMDLVKEYSFDDSDYVSIVVSGFYGIGEIQKKEKFLMFENKTFENRQYCVMGSWHEYLSGIYGDYMVLPPEEKRVGPHEIRVKRT